MKIPITDEETKIANEESMYIYGYLRKKYANESVSHLDICMNAMVFAIIRLMDAYVPPKDQKLFVDKIIGEILRQELANRSINKD